jgi:hypothetical protein
MEGILGRGSAGHRVAHSGSGRDHQRPVGSGKRCAECADGVVGAFRADAARAGVGQLVDELCRLSPEFEALWRENDVIGAHGEAVKQLRHPVLGPIALGYSAFAVDGRPDLSMVVYNPATSADADLIRSLVTPRPASRRR